MAMAPIEQRLDDLAAVQAGIDQQQGEMRNEPLPEFQEVTEEAQSFEPVQVAGPVSGLGKILKSAPKRETVPMIQPGADVEKVGPYQVMPEATPKQAKDIETIAPYMPTEGKPGDGVRIDIAGVAEPEPLFNLDNIKDSDGLKQHIEATARVYGADQLERVSYKDIAAKAAEEGYDEAFIARIIDPAQKTQANPADAYKMMLALVDAGKRAYDLGEKVKAAKKAGTLNSDLTSQFLQAVQLEGVLLKAAKGRQADIARTLGVFSQARSATAERGAMLDALMTEAGGINNAFDLAKSYTALDSRSGRANLSEKTISGTIKDIWFSTWINGLLSSPVTHAKNVVGNMLFTGLQIPERAVASVIGKARNLAFGGEDAIAFDEVYAQAMGFMHGMREGASIAKTAFVKNEPTDAFSKIEATRAGRDPFAVDFGSSQLGGALSKGLRYYGNFVTLPGRALMAEDEFFKAVAYRMELNALATRQGVAEYKRLIGAGIDEATASQKSGELVERLLMDPPAELDEAAKSFGRTTTFTRELEPQLQGVQRFLNTPIMKIFVPFVRTPTNIALEAMARTPGLNLLSPRFLSDFNAGGIRRDMAMARVTLGGGLIYSASGLSLEGRMTGYGPFRREDKMALEGTGWQQFSFVFNKSDIPPEKIKEFERITKVSVGPDKVYISYAGLEPISTLLSVAGSMGEYSMLESGEADLEKMMIAGTMATYTYLGDQPMLSGFSDIMGVLTSGSKDAPTFLYDFMSRATKQVTEFGIMGSPAGVHSSFVAGVERIMNPERSLVIEGSEDVEKNPLDGATKGFWEATKYYCSRNPMCSDSLPPMRDSITGAPKKAGKGNLYEMVSPFRTSDGTTSLAHAILVEYGVPQYMPPKKFNGVELTDDQYDRWITLATDNGRLASRIETLGKSQGLARLAMKDLGAAQSLIKKEISDAYARAKARLIAEDPDLDEALREVKQYQREEGLYKR